MSALKSSNPTNAIINRNFIIRYQTTDEKGTKLVGAGKCEQLVGKELKIKHFNKVLQGGLDKHTFLIRNRLKITFHSK